MQGRSRGLAAAQEPRQAFSLLILWNSLTNRAIWQWDLRRPKKLEGPVLIQKPKCSFLGGGGEDVSDICLLFCIDKCSIQVGHLTLQQAHGNILEMSHCGILKIYIWSSSLFAGRALQSLEISSVLGGSFVTRNEPFLPHLSPCQWWNLGLTLGG